MRGGRLFKLRYTYIDVCKSLRGTLRYLELGGALGQQSPFTHSCESPVPDADDAALAHTHGSPKYKAPRAALGAAQAVGGEDFSSVVLGRANGPKRSNALHHTAVLHV